MTLTRKIKINGMSCDECASRLEGILKGIDGVSDARVNLDKKTAEVILKRIVEDKAFTDVIYDAGFDVIDIY